MRLASPGALCNVGLPITYTKYWSCSGMIHNPDYTSYIPTVSITKKQAGAVEISVRKDGNGLSQTVFLIAIGY